MNINKIIMTKQIKIPKNIKVLINNENNEIILKSIHGQSKLLIQKNFQIKQHSNYLNISSFENNKENKKYLGLYYSLIKTNLKGISQKFKINLFLNGIGFKVNKIDNKLIFKLGYSHDIIIDIPTNIDTSIIKSNQLVIYGSNWEKLTQFAANIKNLKKVEPYKGKGILLKNETVFRKEGKKNKK